MDMHTKIKSISVSYESHAYAQTTNCRLAQKQTFTKI